MAALRFVGMVAAVVVGLHVYGRLAEQEWYRG